MATGATLDECFQAAADATLEVMLANPESLQPRLRRALHVEADALDLALLKFLEELIYYKDAEGNFLRAAAVSVTRAGQPLGGRCDRSKARPSIRHDTSCPAMSRRLHCTGLNVRQTDSGWEATVVLDI